MKSQNSHSMLDGHSHLNYGGLKENAENFELNHSYKIAKGKLQYHARSPSSAAKNCKRKCYNIPIRSAEGHNFVLGPIDNIPNRCESKRYNTFAQNGQEMPNVEFQKTENKLKSDSNGNYNNHSSPPMQRNNLIDSQTAKELPNTVQIKCQNIPDSMAEYNQYVIEQGAVQNLGINFYPAEGRNYFKFEKNFEKRNLVGTKSFVQIPNENLAMPSPPRHNNFNNSIPLLRYNEKYHSQIDNVTTEGNKNEHFRNTFHPKESENGPGGSFSTVPNSDEEDNPKNYFESVRFAIDVSLNLD